nr:glutamine synthetase family protein [Streptomyces sp. NBC_00899]
MTDTTPATQAPTSRATDKASLQADTLAALTRLVEKGELRTVLLGMPDMWGRLVGKRYDARHFLDHVAAQGADVCSYLLATDLDMLPLDGYELASWGTGFGDLYLRPDLARWWPASPGRPIYDDQEPKIREAFLIADTLNQDSTPVQVAPRQMLRRQLQLLKDQFGLSVKAGLECEFSVYRGPAEVAVNSRRPLGAPFNSDYGLYHPKALEQFIRALEETLTGSALPLEAVKTEADPGQIEVTFRYGQAMAAADNHALFKILARTTADWTESTASFMAAPETGTSNGLHLHLSLWSNDTPVLGHHGGASGLSTMGEHAVAGLMEALPQLTPLMLPYANSYKRLAGAFVPSRMCWGYDNRAAAIRVVGHGESVHLEIRIPGADANPYLVLTAAVAAIRHGLTRQQPPCKPVVGTDYGTAPFLPTALTAAADDFASSALAADLLTPKVVAHYTRAARHEASVIKEDVLNEGVIPPIVSDAERERGFSRA